MKKLIFFLSFIFLDCHIGACNTDTNPDFQPKPNIVWITSEDNSKHYMKLFDEHGIETPNIERLADGGIVFDRAFSNSPVCSAARSTLISGIYGPKMASHYHRNMKQVPMPDGVKMFPAYLRDIGYYTTNNAKEDYNIIKLESVWDESSKKAMWRNRDKGQPFFHVHNIGTTHESRLHFSRDKMNSLETETSPESVFVQPNHPDTDLFRYTNAFYRDKIQQMDRQVGKLVEKLKKDGLLENTFIFYFGDHGGVLPGSKGYVSETGLHVPMVVYIPPKYRDLVDFERGSRTDGFVSFVDFGATVLNLAGVPIPEKMDGKPFLGPGVSKQELEQRNQTYSYADRHDEKYDMVRALREGKYKYVRHYQPFHPPALMNNYRYKQLAYQQWQDLYESNELNKIQSVFFEAKQPEALYNVEEDPFETKNLTGNPEYSDILADLRNKLTSREKQLPDLSFYPEYVLVEQALQQPVEFGLQHKEEIQSYIETANLMLQDFNEIETELKVALNSDDAWQRYWGLINCSSFGEQATQFVPKAKKIMQTDSELINRVRAAEFLGIIGEQNPVSAMTKALYQSKDPVEALLILNSVVLMRDFYQNYSFDIEIEEMEKPVRNAKSVKRRLKYLGVI